MPRLTKKKIQKEIIKCSNPAYFMCNYVKISRPDKPRPILFKLFDYQKEIVQKVQNNRYVIVNKSRQMGLTTLIAGYCLWKANFYRDQEIVVLATKTEVAGTMVRRVKKMYKQLPPWLQISKIVTDNRTSFELGNGSSVKASSTTTDAGRSLSLSLLVVDEAAHIDNMEEIWEAVYSTTQAGGAVVAASTPNGAAGWFYNIFRGAERQENGFVPITVHWKQNPEYTQEWFDNYTKNMSKKQIAQELELDFRMSGDTVVDGEDICAVAEHTINPKRRAGIDRNLWIWKNREKGVNYLIAVDVARGDGEDFSAFHVFKISNMEQVAEYKGKLGIDIFSDFLFQIGKEYNDAQLVIEANNLGHQVGTNMYNKNYPNLLWTKKSNGKAVTQYEAEYTESVPGITITPRNRPLIISKMEEHIRNRVLKIKSKRTVAELETFIWKNGKPQAQKGYNDDLITSLALAAWVRDGTLTKNEELKKKEKIIIEKMTKSEGCIDTSMYGMSTYNKSVNVTDRYVEGGKSNPYVEFRWLLKG